MSQLMETKKLIAKEGLLTEYSRLAKAAHKLLDGGKVYIYNDEEDGNPENKFFTAEVVRPLPDGLMFISSAREIDEVLRNIEEYLNDWK